MGQVKLGRFVNLITWTQPNLLKKNFMTQPNLPTLKNRPNPMSWVGSGWFWQVGGFTAHPYSKSSQTPKAKFVELIGLLNAPNLNRKLSTFFCNFKWNKVQNQNQCQKLRKTIELRRNVISIIIIIIGQCWLITCWERERDYH